MPDASSTPTVSLLKHDAYEPREAVYDAVVRLLEPLGGIKAFVRAGQRVVLKPNLVMARSIEQAATTHPSVVWAVAKLCLEQGAQVSAGDSPGLGSARSVAKSCGILDVLDELGVPIIEFTPVEVNEEGQTFRRHSLARELLEADVVINLPKLKTHAQMLMTLAVKNLFGAVVGPIKFQWHYRAGCDRLTFARMLAEVARTIAPALSIVDGVIGMDGLGPTSGNPNPVGLLAAGADPCAVDAMLCRAVGIDPDLLWTLKAASEAGDTAWRQARWVGTDPEALRPARWELPKLEELAMVRPPFLKRLPAFDRWMGKQIAAYPHPHPQKCVRCGACARVCPAEAIVQQEGGISIRRDRCIRCYCCEELCPHDAMELRVGVIGRWLSRWAGRATP